MTKGWEAGSNTTCNLETNTGLPQVLMAVQLRLDLFRIPTERAGNSAGDGQTVISTALIRAATESNHRNRKIDRPTSTITAFLYPEVLVTCRVLCCISEPWDPSR